MNAGAFRIPYTHRIRTVRGWGVRIACQPPGGCGDGGDGNGEAAGASLNVHPAPSPHTLLTFTKRSKNEPPKLMVGGIAPPL